MATPLTDSINALTAYANEVTGKSDTTLSDAVGSLVNGYNNIVSTEFIKSYTVPASWENSTDGNIPAILIAIGLDYTDLLANEVYVVIVRNNQAEQKYKGKAFFIPAYSNSKYGIRNETQIIPASSSWNFYVSEGAVIDVYKLTYNLP